jgi:hypothetical protein
MNSIPIMKENRPTRLIKIAGWLLIIALLIAASYNISQGNVIRPTAFFIMLLGFILFAIGKLSVIIRKKKISFGTGLMSENMANLYRLGYWLMIAGLLATFAP